MDIESVANHLLDTIHMRGRLTPDLERDFHSALDQIVKGAEFDCERATATGCLQVVLSTEPHRFDGEDHDDPIKMTAATLQAVYNAIAVKYKMPFPKAQLGRNFPVPVGLALREAAQNLEDAEVPEPQRKEPDDVGSESQAG